MKASGIYDFHVHIGETIGGHLLADSWKSFNLLFEHNGLEGIGVFVTESPNEPLSSKLARMRKASLGFSGKVFWHLTPRQLDIGKLERILKEDTDIKLYTTYREAGLYQSYESIERFMEEMPSPKKRLLVHCEDDEIISEYSERYPFHKPSDHCLRRPEKAEIAAVEKLLNLSIKYHYPLHIVHISSPQAALLVQQAKKEADYITCETAPHYLLLNEEVLSEPEGHRWLCSPPIRSENSRGLLLELLQDGVFDIIASDHCAFSSETKDTGILYPAKTPMGIAGSGALFTLLAENLVEKGKLTMEQLFALISYTSAKMMDFTVAEDALSYERLGAPIPVIPSWANTPNPWMDYWSYYELRRHNNNVY